MVQGAKEGQFLISIEKSGCVQQRNPDGTLFGVYSPDQPVSMLNGDKVGRFAQQLRRLGAAVHERMMMVDILKDANGRCGGVLALDLRTGKFHAFRGKETIIATGTIGWVMKPTIMSAEDTGDAHAILARHGLGLVDMEMTTFDHAASVPYSMSGDVVEHAGILTLNSDQWDRALNSKGEKYCEKYFTSRSHLDNPSAGFAMFELLTMQEVMKGETIYYDTTNAGPGYSYGMVLGFLEDAPYGIGYTYPAAEKCNQGTIITCGHVNQTAKMETEIPGLYSALTGLTYYGQTQAFGSGWVADGAAAEAADSDDIPEVELGSVEQAMEHIFGLLEKEEPEGGVRAAKVLDDIRNASVNLQYPRNAEGIKAALDEYARLREEELPVMYCADKSRATNGEWRNAIEAENVLMNGECVALASDMRKETRPWFYRSDFPKIDNENWFKHIVCTYDGNGGWTLSTAEVNTSRLSAEEIQANLLDIDLNAEI